MTTTTAGSPDRWEVGVMSYTMSATVHHPYAKAVSAVRDALAEQGFRGADRDRPGRHPEGQAGRGHPRPGHPRGVPPPPAHLAIRADPSVAAMLPCNVDVRSVDDNSCVVEAFDPDAMTAFSSGDAVRAVAEDAKARLTATLASL